MGASVSRSDFEWSFTDQPHGYRRKAMLSKFAIFKQILFFKMLILYVFYDTTNMASILPFNQDHDITSRSTFLPFPCFLSLGKALNITVFCLPLLTSDYKYNHILASIPHWVKATLIASAINTILIQN